MGGAQVLESCTTSMMTMTRQTRRKRGPDGDKMEVCPMSVMLAISSLVTMGEGPETDVAERGLDST